ncbi:TIGR04255 family protein [Rhodococcus rhodochrous]|uniref:TIGR04255 family protein n=1 Tax=Rhodococcus rhodochrous TaxID=1829 RepID=UPI0009C0D735|nr:TIGR04255 family protein [Rhodococcus rhodochrous]
MSAPSLYRNAPIALVILEVRHPRTEPPAGAALDVLKNALLEWTPIARQEQGFQLDLNTGTQTPIFSQKLVSRDLHTAVTFRHEAIAIEAMSYKDWPRFRSLAEQVFRARQDIAPVDGVERIGLRYIDEIRVPTSPPIVWADWVEQSLLGPSDMLAGLGLRAKQQQSIVEYTTETSGESFTLRYGAGRGSVIQSSPNLKRVNEPPEDGDFFLIDTDAAWSDVEGGIPEFNVENMLNILDRLHSPIKNMFEALITDKLREEVLDVAS